MYSSRWAKYSKRCSMLVSDAAFATAKEMPKMAFAPSRPLFGVPSNSRSLASIVFCSRVSIPISAGVIMLRMLSTAFKTPRPW